MGAKKGKRQVSDCCRSRYQIKTVPLGSGCMTQFVCRECGKPCNIIRVMYSSLSPNVVRTTEEYAALCARAFEGVDVERVSKLGLKSIIAAAIGWCEEYNECDFKEALKSCLIDGEE